MRNYAHGHAGMISGMNVRILLFTTMFLTVPGFTESVNIGMLLKRCSLTKGGLLHPSDGHRRRRSSFGRFCASTVTCLRDPISFTLLLYALSLSARHTPSFGPVRIVPIARNKWSLTSSPHMSKKAPSSGHTWQWQTCSNFGAECPLIWGSQSSTHPWVTEIP
jgi:hypothetical protein